MTKSDSVELRIPPQSTEVEKHVIGACLLGHPTMEAVDTLVSRLAESDFYLERHAVLFRGIQALHTQRQAVDLITLSDWLVKNRCMDMAGGDAYLMEISAEVASDANLGQHCEIIREKALLREMIYAETKNLEEAYGNPGNVQAFLDRAEQRVCNVRERTRRESEGLRDMTSILKASAQEFDKIADGQESRLLTGIPALDTEIGGFRESSLNLLAADSGMGKSALALQIAVTCGRPTAFFPIEMTAHEEVERLLAHGDANLNARGLATPALVRAKRAQLAEAMVRLAGHKLYIDDRRRQTTLNIERESRRLRRRVGDLGLIVVDYLQLLKTPSYRGDKRNREVAGISEELLNISYDLRAPILAVASLSREMRKRDDKRPVKSDLRDAGELEYDAHTIIFLYREALYNAKVAGDAQLRMLTEVLMPKIRGGEQSRALLNFDGARSWFFGVSEVMQKAYWSFLSGQDFLEGEAKKKGGRKDKGPAPSSNWGHGTPGARQASDEDEQLAF